MRAGIGILSLLVVVAIIMFAMFSGPGGGYVPTVVKQGSNGRSQANQISGRDEEGMPVQDSIKLDELDVDGNFRGLKVVSVVPTGPMATAYGLAPGDEITEINQMKVADNNDAELSKAQVYEAYGRNQTLTIQRGGQTVTVTPTTPLSQFHPEMFGKPGVQNVPTH